MTDEKNQKKTEEKANNNEEEGRWEETAAGKKYKYTKFEQLVSLALAAYLMAAMIFIFWFILDVWSGQYLTLKLIVKGDLLPTNGTRVSLFRLILFGIAGGWLGGTLSALRSLQAHYAGPTSNVGDKEKQEITRFHPNWWMRWFLGPWIGAGLAFVVIALVRSGVLVFAASTTQTNSITATEYFATFGLGALVGLGAKDVVEKLIDSLKKWLKVEEPEVKELAITPKEVPDVKYGGNVIKFEVKPRIPVNWAVNPPDAGTIINGFFSSADKPPTGVDTRDVIVTATSKTDSDRSVSRKFLLKK